jgi:hypothetical protein
MLYASLLEHHNSTASCSISVVQNLEVTQLAKKFPAFMKLNIQYHAPKSTTLLDPILPQFSPSYPFIHSQLRSHFQATLTLYINLQGNLLAWPFLINILNACLISYGPHPANPPLSDRSNTTG